MSDTKQLTREQANARISELLALASEAISEAEALADEHKLSFSSPLDHVYGMGGSYDGNWQDETDEWGDPKEHGWYPSSQSC